MKNCFLLIYMIHKNKFSFFLIPTDIKPDSFRQLSSSVNVCCVEANQIGQNPKCEMRDSLHTLTIEHAKGGFGSGSQSLKMKVPTRWTKKF